MASLILVVAISLPSTTSSSTFRSNKNDKTHRRQRIVVPKTEWRCSATDQPQPQRRLPKQLTSSKPQTDAERGIGPIGFLTKYDISLRERYKSMKDPRDEIFQRFMNLKEISSGFELLGLHRHPQHREDYMEWAPDVDGKQVFAVHWEPPPEIAYTFFFFHFDTIMGYKSDHAV